MTREAMFLTLTLLLIGAAGGLLLLPNPVEPVPLVAPFERFPSTLDGWSGSEGVPTNALPPDPRAVHTLAMTYRRGDQEVWASVGYYPVQAEGQRPPARQLLFPGGGWSELSEQTVQIALDTGGASTLPANLILMRTSSGRRAVLYWYQVRSRSIASDHWYRAALLYNRAVHGRADGALIRVAAAMPDATDPSAVLATQMRFVRAFHPELLRSLPR